jgi:hypothetical protein
VKARRLQIAEDSELARIEADKTWQQVSMSTDLEDRGNQRNYRLRSQASSSYRPLLPAACLIAGQYAQYRHSDVANEPMTLKQIAKTVERALVLLILLVAKESETFSQNAAAAGK